MSGFIKVQDEVYRVLVQEDTGCWVIRFESPISPQYLSAEQIAVCQRVPAPERYLESIRQDRKRSQAEEKRFRMIEPMVREPQCISDSKLRSAFANRIAAQHHTTARRVYRLYLLYLAQGSLMHQTKKRAPQTEINVLYQSVIEKLYYSAKRPSLRSVYDCMLLEHFADADGKLLDGYPSWHSFRQYYYRHALHKGSRKQISREGLSDYQRNHRMLFGSSWDWKSQLGSYQMDMTLGDVHLVSHLDPHTVIGRPNLYLAVDTLTGLIAGFYAGMECGEQAVLYCLANAAQDKVKFCAKYGITITADQWCSAGLPKEIITDRGKEFCGARIDAFCERYGVERESLPPFRPDQKSLVEKSFGLIQNSYAPALRGKGMIEPDAQERWATDYRSQAMLTMTDYIKLLIHTIVYLNSARVLRNYAILNLRPTCNPALYQQMVGRSTRLYDGKDHALVIDIIPSDETNLRNLCMAPSLFGIDPSRLSKKVKAKLADGQHDLLEICNELSEAYAEDTRSINIMVEQLDALLSDKEQIIERNKGRTLRDLADDYCAYLEECRIAEDIPDFGPLSVEICADDTHRFKVTPSYHEVAYISEPDLVGNATLDITFEGYVIGKRGMVRAVGTGKIEDIIRLLVNYCETKDYSESFAWSSEFQEKWKNMTATERQQSMVRWKYAKSGIDTRDAEKLSKLEATRLINLSVEVSSIP